MDTRRGGRWLGVGAVAVLCWSATGVAAEGDVPKRVAELLAVLAGPDARGANLRAAVAAEEELVALGGPAAPQLVEAVLTKPPASNVGYTAGKILMAIGKPALPAIRARWAELNDERRWRLVPILEKHDPGSVKEYAYHCLDSDGWVRSYAWSFVLGTKDARAKDRYFDALTVEGKETPYIRWQLLPSCQWTYDEKREIDLLIDLLKPTSWVAKGEGNPPVSCEAPAGWPDGREGVIRGLHHQKVKRAAPAILEVLLEKGPGVGYFAETIIPVLGDLGDKDAIPELERIVASKPGPGEREDLHPYTHTGYPGVRKLAADAIQRIKDAKR